MALKKQMKEKLHIWSVDARIFLSLIEDHNFKCIYKLYVSQSLLSDWGHGLLVCRVKLIWFMLVLASKAKERL